MNNEIKEKMTIGKAKKILRGFLAKDCYYDTPLYYAIPYILDYITTIQEENKEAHDFDETIKDIKDNLIARINRQECEIHNLKEELQAYKQERENILDKSKRLNYKTRIDKAIEYIECGKTFDDIETARIIDKYEKILLEILKGSDKE